MKLKKQQLIRLALLAAIIVFPVVVPGDAFSGTLWGYRVGGGRLWLSVAALLTFFSIRHTLPMWDRVELIGFVVMFLSHSLWLLFVYQNQSSSLGVLFGGIFVGVPFLSSLVLILVGNLASQSSKQEPDQPAPPTASSGSG